MLPIAHKAFRHRWREKQFSRLGNTKHYFEKNILWNLKENWFQNKLREFQNTHRFILRPRKIEIYSIIVMWICNGLKKLFIWLSIHVIFQLILFWLGIRFLSKKLILSLISRKTIFQYDWSSNRRSSILELHFDTKLGFQVLLFDGILSQRKMKNRFNWIKTWWRIKHSVRIINWRK